MTAEQWEELVDDKLEELQTHDRGDALIALRAGDRCPVCADLNPCSEHQEEPKPPASRPRPRGRRLRIVELFHELGNGAAVARIIGISEPAVHRHLKLAGLR